jgi:hypothetical protein
MNGSGQEGMHMGIHESSEIKIAQALSVKGRHRVAVRVVVLLSLAAAAVVGCRLPATATGGAGSMMITLTQSLAKDLNPGVDLTIASYDLSGIGPSSASFSTTGITASTYDATNIATGAWTVTAIGRNAAGTAIVQDSQAVTVMGGQSTAVTMNCIPINGNGTLSLNLTWPSGVITTPAVVATLTQLGGTASQSLSFTVSATSASWTSSTVANGYYTLTIQLEETAGTTTTLWGRTMTVLILTGQITTGSWALAASDLALVSGGINVTLTSTTNPPIAVTLSGNASTLMDGSSMTVSASASVTPDSWQWYLNGAPIANATGASVTISTAALAIAPYWLDVVAYKGGTAGSNGCQFHVALRTYTTNFPLTESPISENGSWINGGSVGLDWNNVITTPGLAQGQGPSSVQYSDPTAILGGTWAPNQMAQATVYTVNPNENGMYQEVELRLRNTVAPHSITGYEITFACRQDSTAYTQVVRWNGALGDFTYLFGQNLAGSQYGVANGDVVKATIVGNLISVYRNGALVCSVTDSTYTTGNPGIGFDYGCGTTYNTFGFTSFSASELSK